MSGVRDRMPSFDNATPLLTTMSSSSIPQDPQNGSPIESSSIESSKVSSSSPFDDRVDPYTGISVFWYFGMLAIL
jgi:hypothetical protein